MMRNRALLFLYALVACATVAAGQSQPAGRALFVGTYTGADSKGIYAFRFDDRAGTLTPAGLVAETPSPSFLTLSHDGRTLFAVNEVSNYEGQRSGSVSSFTVDAASLKLTSINTQSSRGADPCHLALDATGRTLAVANYTGGNFALFPVAADGKLGAASAVLEHAGDAPGPNQARQNGPHAHQVLFDPSNKFLLGVDLGLDRVFVYRFDAARGSATPNDPPAAALPPGSGPRHLALEPGAKQAFVISELLSTMTSFGWDAATGRLTLRQSASTLPADFKSQSSTAEVVVHPTGRFVYGSNRGHDSIAVFAVGANGQLRLVETESTRGQTPRSFTIDPTGRWLLAANQKTNTIAIYRIDPATGALSPSGPLVAAGAPVCLLFRP